MSEPQHDPAPPAGPEGHGFVGRSREMDLLRAALAEANDGRGQVALLAGEPGIGKTRAGQELARYAEAQGFKLLWGWCYEGEGAPPYWPWVGPFRTYVEQTEPDLLRDQMGPGIAEIAGLVPEVGDKLGDVPPPAQVEPEQARFRLFEAVSSFLKRASADGPLLLVLDDIHWADEPSLLLLQFIARQIDAVFDDIRIDAVKIGMLSRPEVIETVAAGLERHRVTKLVLDPVMVAKSGDLLLAAEAVSALRERLLPLAMVVTPNLPEAAVLLAEDAPDDEAEMAPACERLLALGPQWVLLKGGHMAGPESIDLLMGGEISRRFAAPRVATRNTHGTGCTLSSAITAGLAQGLDVIEAVGRAKDYVTAALKAADRLDVGSGHGPVHHFHDFW